jgi:murein DD-endopeptidase MepM/ murein hydrolase activator NlpD
VLAAMLAVVGVGPTPTLAQDTGATEGGVLRVARDLRLTFPVDCAIGKDCWVTSYVDDDPGPGVTDYKCGALSKQDSRPGKEGTDIGHKGTDIGIGRLGRDVAVLAVADGTVAGVRDGMPDISTRAPNPPDIKGRECGNGVRLDHGDGWTTQYCHMREGSITVSNGQTVTAGQKLGLIGLSGMTEHPHVHVQVSRDDVIYDPFNGRPASEGCQGTALPLWTAEVMAKLRYESVVLNNIGFADREPNRLGARNGDYPEKTFSATAPMMVVYVDMIGPAKGDKLLMQIIAPDGGPIHESTSSFDEKGYAQWFGFAGLRLGKRPAWDKGRYTAVVTVERPGKGVVAWKEARIRVE